MKTLLATSHAAIKCNALWSGRHQTRIFLMATITSLILTVGCTKQGQLMPEDESLTPSALPAREEMVARNVLLDYVGVGDRTAWELQQARAATARYRNINHAYADGYADIDVVLPNMGHHFLKSDLLDAHFDVRRPEILVYNPDDAGNFELVAVEYAVPLNLSTTAPEGFTGNSDVWTPNAGFGLWLLHAWVWAYNPDGVFNPTNPDVHVE